MSDIADLRYELQKEVCRKILFHWRVYKRVKAKKEAIAAAARAKKEAAAKAAAEKKRRRMGYSSRPKATNSVTKAETTPKAAATPK